MRELVNRIYRNYSIGEWLQLLSLTTLAFLQPLLSLLAENPEFFSAHKTGGTQLVVFVIIATLLPPTVLFLTTLPVKFISKKWRHALMAIYIVILLFIVFLPLLGKFELLGSVGSMIGSALIALALTIFYNRNKNVQSSLSQFSFIAILVPLLFFFNADIQKLLHSGEVISETRAKKVKPTPIVMIVFDEFTVNSIMNADHKIDATLYPNLAWFSQRSHWFRNATTVADKTTNAIPAIVAGKYAKGVLPTYKNYPESLFTLLSPTHVLNVHESATQLCPPDLCTEIDKQKSFTEQLIVLFADSLVLYLHVIIPKEYSDSLPDISQGWTNFLSHTEQRIELTTVSKDPPDRNWLLARIHSFLADDREALWDRFLRTVSESSQPSLNFLHILLPHVAFEYLADGNNYGRQRIPGLKNEKWSDDAWATTQARQRYLMQLGFVDKLLGELFRTLENKGKFSESMIIVTADHGVSFKTGDYRRSISVTNYMDILPIPLLIKLPNQIEGSISDLNVETVDILPTILEQLNLDIGDGLEGISVFNVNKLKTREHKSVYTLAGGSQTIYYDSKFVEKYKSVENRLALFGEDKDPDKLYAVGIDKDLMGQRTQDLLFREVLSNRIETRGNVTRNTYDRHSGPRFVSGIVSGHWAKELPIRLAFSVNGVVHAVTKTYLSLKSGIYEFAFILPESAYRDVSNRVEIVSIHGAEKNEFSLRRFQFDAAMQYSLTKNEDNSFVIENDFGTPYKLEEGALKGYLDILELTDEGYRFRGWAVDPNEDTTALDVVLFVDAKFVASVIPRSKRSDVAAVFKRESYLYSGYVLDAGSLDLTQICSKNFDLYALSDNGTASKIKISQKSLQHENSPDC